MALNTLSGRAKLKHDESPALHRPVCRIRSRGASLLGAQRCPRPGSDRPGGGDSRPESADRGVVRCRRDLGAGRVGLGESSHAVDDVRDAADGLLDSLSRTPTRPPACTQFATIAQQLASRAPWSTTPPWATDGALRQGHQRLLQPAAAPAVERVNIYSTTGQRRSRSSQLATTARTTAASSTPTGTSPSTTATETSPELVVLRHRRRPDRLRLQPARRPVRRRAAAGRRRRHRPQQRPRSRSRWTGRSRRPTRSRRNGSRMLAIGVGSALSNPASRTGWSRSPGPRSCATRTLAEVDSLNDVDVALVTDFEDLAGLMRGGGARAVLAVADDPQARPDRRRARPTARARLGHHRDADRVPGGNGFDWILPDTHPGGLARRWPPTPTASPSSSGSRTRPRRTRAAQVG